MVRLTIHFQVAFHLNKVLLLISTLLSLALSEASLKPTSPVVDPEETQQRGQRESGYGYAGGNLNYYYSGYPQQWNSGYNSYNRYPNNYQYQYQVPGYQQQYYQGGQGWYPSSYYRGGGFGYNNNILPYNNGGYYTNYNNNLGFGGRYNSQAYGAPIRQGYY